LKLFRAHEKIFESARYGRVAARLSREPGSRFAQQGESFSRSFFVKVFLGTMRHDDQQHAANAATNKLDCNKRDFENVARFDQLSRAGNHARRICRDGAVGITGIRRVAAAGRGHCA
jgi:hypothetical protein